MAEKETLAPHLPGSFTILILAGHVITGGEFTITVVVEVVKQPPPVVLVRVAVYTPA